MMLQECQTERRPGLVERLWAWLRHRHQPVTAPYDPYIAQDLNRRVEESLRQR